jgi:tRNA-binding EMAP/Myf-like protein
LEPIFYFVLEPDRVKRGWVSRGNLCSADDRELFNTTFRECLEEGLHVSTPVGLVRSDAGARKILEFDVFFGYMP